MMMMKSTKIDDIYRRIDYRMLNQRVRTKKEVSGIVQRKA
jgi:hypothetical protein